MTNNWQPCICIREGWGYRKCTCPCHKEIEEHVISRDFGLFMKGHCKYSTTIVDLYDDLLKLYFHPAGLQWLKDQRGWDTRATLKFAEKQLRKQYVKNQWPRLESARLILDRLAKAADRFPHATWRIN